MSESGELRQDFSIFADNTMSIPERITDNQDGVTRMMTQEIPTHFTVKIEAFSLLSKASIERYETSEFEAGGYKWKLSLYPNGNKNKNEKDNLSLYLSMAETKTLPRGWEVSVNFRLFLLDQIRDNYLMVQDSKVTGRRFHAMKTEWGFEQFISLKSFMDASNGYLIGDTCVFGAEVFVCKERSIGKGECLTMIKDSIATKTNWRIENFSKLDNEYYESKTFNAGDQKWKVQLYPKGKGSGMGNSVSLYLALANPTTLPPGQKFHIEFDLRLVDQMYGKHISGKANLWFSASSQDHGWSRFVSHSYLYQQNTGILVKDTCLVEVEVTVIGVLNTFP